MYSHAERPRLEMLDGLRGIAAICVMLHHYTENTSFPLAHLAFYFVDVFFIMSGFVIAMKYRASIAAGMGFRDFALRRLIRLYPVFAVSVIIGALALALKCSLSMASFSTREAFLAIVLNGFFLPYQNAAHIDLFKNYIIGVIFPLNQPAWSLFYELLVCTVFFAYVRSSLKLTPWIVAAAAICMFLLISQGGGTGGPGTFLTVDGFTRVTLGFFAGVFVHEIRTRSGTAPLATPTPRLFPMALAAILALVLLSFQQGAGERYVFIIVLALAPLIVCAVSAARVPTALRSICSGLGALSYPVYCLHYPLLHVSEGMSIWLQLALTEFQIVLLATSLTAILAAFLAFYAEAKMRNALAGALGRRAAATTAAVPLATAP